MVQTIVQGITIRPAATGTTEVIKCHSKAQRGPGYKGRITVLLQVLGAVYFNLGTGNLLQANGFPVNIFLTLRAQNY